MRVLSRPCSTLRTLATAVAGGAMIVGVTLPSWAVPTPGAGPTAGGTTVTDTIPAGVTLATFSGGAAFTIAMGSDGNVYAWGDNSVGQLGDGTMTSSAAAVRVQLPAGVAFTQVKAGAVGAIALGSDGNVYAWGNNVYGQLGDGTTTNAAAPVQMQLPAGSSVTELFAGSGNLGVRTADGSVYLTGRGDDGQLGNDDTASSTVPVLVQAPTGVTLSQVQLGEFFAAALGSDGRIYTWGNGDDGQLGIGENYDDPETSSLVPVEALLPAGITVTDFSVGSGFVIAIGSDGVTYAWGEGNYGQLGDGQTDTVYEPQVVTTPTGVSYTAVYASGMSVVAAGSDGALYAWGSSMYGQAGDGSVVNRVLSPVQVTMPAGVTFTSITPALYHYLATGSDGETYAWGLDMYHQLGVDSTEFSQATPTRVSVADLTVDSVSFGDAAGTDLAVAGDEWNAITPAHGCGIVDVSIVYTQLGQTNSEVITEGFTYGSAPAVTEQPASVALAEGVDQVTLTAAASGDEEPTVQWQQRTDGGEWSDVVDGTDTTLTATVTTASDYRAVFSNCLGTVETQVASVTPYVAPAPAPVTPVDPATPEQRTGPVASGTPTAADPVVDDGTVLARPSTGLLARTGVVVGSAAALAAALIGGGAILTVLRRRSPQH